MQIEFWSTVPGEAGSPESEHDAMVGPIHPRIHPSINVDDHRHDDIAHPFQQQDKISASPCPCGVHTHTRTKPNGRSWGLRPPGAVQPAGTQHRHSSSALEAAPRLLGSRDFLVESAKDRQGRKATHPATSLTPPRPSSTPTVQRSQLASRPRQERTDDGVPQSQHHVLLPSWVAELNAGH
jgi:hypothetical protein